MTTRRFPEDVADLEATRRFSPPERTPFGPGQFQDANRVNISSALRRRAMPDRQKRNESLTSLGEFLQIQTRDPERIAETLRLAEKSGFDINQVVDRQASLNRRTGQAIASDPSNVFRASGGDFTDLAAARSRGMTFPKNSTTPSILGAMDDAARLSVLQRAGFTPDEVEVFEDALAAQATGGALSTLVEGATAIAAPFDLAGGLIEQYLSNLSQGVGGPAIPGTITAEERGQMTLGENLREMIVRPYERAQDPKNPAFALSMLVPFPAIGATKAGSKGIAVAGDILEHAGDVWKTGVPAVKGGVDNAIARVASERGGGTLPILFRERAAQSISEGVEEIMTDLDTFDGVIAYVSRTDLFSRIATLPGMKYLSMTLDPAVLVTGFGANPQTAQDWKVLGSVIQGMMKHEGAQKGLGAFQRLARLGAQTKVFGKAGDDGLLLADRLKGESVGDLVANPGKFAARTTDEQKEWLAAARELEDAKLAFLQRNGIEFSLLTFDEGGAYASRRMFAKLGPDGDLVDYGFVGKGPGRPGAKMTEEKHRFFPDEEIAIEQGYRYLPYEDSLLLNIQGAYNRVADKKLSDWVFAKLGPDRFRTAGASENAVKAASAAQRRVDSLKNAVTRLQTARVGGASLSSATIRSIGEIAPEVKSLISKVARITLDDLVRAGKQATVPPKVLPIPTAGTIKKLNKVFRDAVLAAEAAPNNRTLQEEAKRVASQLGFAKFRFAKGKAILEGTPAGASFTEAGEFVIRQNPTKLLNEARESSLDEILGVIRGTPVKGKTKTGKPVTRFEGGLLNEARAARDKAVNTRARSAETASRIKAGEFTINAPAFSGNILRGPGAQDIANGLNDAFGSEAGRFLTAMTNVNKVNSVFRYFKLAGDASIFGIQLLFMAGSDPTTFGKTVGGFTRALFDDTFHARYLFQNRAVVQNSRDLILARGGTEFTEAFSKSGILASGPAGAAAEVFQIRRAQRAFESAMDVAGIEMRKSLDHLATTPERVRDVEAFVNEFRGLSSSARLGVSNTWRQFETLTTLAPKYNRAIAALVADLFKGGLRGRLAWEKMARGTMAVVGTAAAVEGGRALNDGLEFGSEAFWDRIANKINPASFDFLTWNVAGQRVGPGSKVRSVVNMLGRTFNDPSSLVNEVKNNPALRFIRGNLSPVAGIATDYATGETFLGADTRDGLVPQTGLGGEYFPMPIWLDSMLTEGGSLKGRAVRGGVEFLGGRAYPEQFYDVVDQATREFSRARPEKYGPDGVDYEGLDKVDRDTLRLIPEVAAAFAELDTQNKVSTKDAVQVLFGERDRQRADALDSFKERLDLGPRDADFGNAIRQFRQEWFQASSVHENPEMTEFFSDSDNRQYPRDYLSAAYWSADAPEHPVSGRPDFEARDHHRNVILTLADAMNVSRDYILNRYRSLRFADEPVVARTIAEYEEWDRKRQQFGWFNLHRSLADWATERPAWKALYEEMLDVRRAEGDVAQNEWIASFGAGASRVRAFVSDVDKQVTEARLDLRRINTDFDVGFSRYTDSGATTPEGAWESMRGRVGTDQLVWLVDAPGRKISEINLSALVAEIDSLEDLASADVGDLARATGIGGNRIASYMQQAQAILEVAAREPA